ncbi:MAG: NACHT domain-containing protein [Magnetococcales bacterium]|nr:NACHT domain-containing protein [Magnetococcales bacterium]
MSTQPGALESNAGDRFHVLWACRRCLAMLDPRTDLRMVVVEGVAQEDDPGKDGSNDLFLAADLAEYHSTQPECNDLTTANRVVVSQLKCSTRHPGQVWTTARLCQTSGKQKPHSILSRMAELYRGFLDHESRDAVLARLTLRLVSNRSMDHKLQAALLAAQTHLPPKNDSTQVDLKFLLSQPDIVPHQEILNKLHAASGLQSKEFTDFLGLLDFSNCGESGRIGQRLELFREVGALVDGDADPALLRLQEFIVERGQPGGGAKRPMRREDVLLALGCHHDDDLFPAPVQFQSVEKMLKTQAAACLVDQISKFQPGKIVVHGGAGMGKTTVIQQLVDVLPPGSKVISYDCYGGGTYTQTRNERHSDRRALQQLANTLALELGIHFLVRSSDHIPDQRREFQRRLNAAATKMRQLGNGWLVLVIDAADNSIAAMQQLGESTCFIHGLWELDLPDNVRLLVTCRTSRRETLGYPTPGVRVLELPAFAENDSALLLRGVFPQATDSQCHRFHQFTHHTPRLQAYLLEGWRQQTAVDLDHLMATPVLGIKLEDVFQEMWQAASLELPEPCRPRMTWLALLRAPVDRTILALLCQVSSEQMDLALHRLETGLVQREEGLGFQDEDFENFVKNRILPENEPAIHAQLAQFLEPLISENGYAARHLAFHDEKGQRWDALLQLAIQDPWPTESAIPDPIPRQEVPAERVERALRVALNHDKKLDALKLLLLQAEIASLRHAVSSLVDKHPDLAVLYDDPVRVNNSFLPDHDWGSLGETHFRCAAMLSRYPTKRERALHHYKMGEVWLDEWQAMPDKQRWNHSITAELLACKAETIFRHEGLEQALADFMRWSPFSFVLDAIGIFASNLADEISETSLSLLWQEKKIHPLVAGVLLTAILRTDNRNNPILAEKVTRGIINSFIDTDDDSIRQYFNGQSNLRNTNQALWLNLCETMASHHVNRQIVLKMLQQIQFSFPVTDTSTGWDSFIRSIVINEYLSGEIFQHAKKTQPHAILNKTDHLEQKRMEHYEKKLEIFLPILRLRIKCCVESPLLDKAQSELLKAVTSCKRYDYHRDWNLDFRLVLLYAVETVLYCQGNGDNILEQLKELSKDLYDRHILIRDLAKLLLRHKVYRNLGLDWLEETVNRMSGQHLETMDKQEFMAQCAHIARPHDHELGQRFFNKAVEASQGADEAALHLLRNLLELATPLVGNITSSHARTLALDLVRAAFAFHEFRMDASRLVLEESLALATDLYPPVGLQVAVAWDAHDVISLNHSTSIILAKLFKKGMISPTETFALARLAGEDPFPTPLILDILDRLVHGNMDEKNRLRRLFPTLSLWIRKDVPLEKRHAIGSEILDWLKKYHLINLPGVAELQKMLAIQEIVEQSKKRSASMETPDWNHPQEEKTLPTPEKLLSNIPTPHWCHLDQVWVAMDNLSYQLWPEFINSLHHQIDRQDRVKYLDKLVTATDGIWSIQAESMMNALFSALDAWHFDEQVKKWQNLGIRLLLEHHLYNLISGPYFNNYLSKLIEKFHLSPAQEWSLLLGKGGKNVRPSYVWSNRYFVVLLAQALDTKSRHELVNWAMSRLNGSLSTSPPFPALAEWQEDESHDFLPQFFLTLLGHPDKRVRWRAMHAIRQWVRSGDSFLLGSLLALDATQFVPPCASPEMPFLWMSARLFLALLCDRLVHELPDLVHPHLGWLLDRALDQEFPHAVVRFHAARAALDVEKVISPNILNPALRARLDEHRARLKWILNPRLNLPDRYSKWMIPGWSLTWDIHRQDRRIEFDSTDTLPYWFAPMGRIFGLTPLQIAEKAEKFICDQWELTQMDMKRSKQAVYKHGHFSLRRHSHGSLPVIEDFRIYAAYHAQFCVAGALADEHQAPFLELEEIISDDNIDSWQSWFHSQHQHHRFWIADRLDPTPLDPQYWGEWHMEETSETVTDTDFETALGLKIPHPNDWLIIVGNVSFSSYGQREHIDIASALVSPDRAVAVMEAWQNAKSPYEYAIPYQGHFSDDVGTSKHIEGWINLSEDDPILDRDDPLHREEPRPALYTPGQLLINYFQLVGDALSKKYHPKENDTPIWQHEGWNDAMPSDQENYKFYSSGNRIHFSLPALIKFLTDIKKLLIIEVQIDRKMQTDKNPDSMHDVSYPAWRIYLLHPDGTLQWQNGTRRIPMG